MSSSDTNILLPAWDTDSVHRFHLLPNAHLDPVWLWDWREGLNEGISTCRAALALMDEFPELTFMRGEAAIYEHIQRHDPDTFRRIRERIEEGRWDVVGGTWIQSDTNLPATETFVRQYQRGLRYFREALGVRVRVGWAADSFGHTAGLPDILAAAGIEAYACTRPFPKQLPIAKPAFWWEGPGGGRVLAYRPAIGWYGAERDEIPRRFDALRQRADADGLRNVACFYGLGNHGGGPTRRQILDIRRWAEAHPDVRVEHSTLHGFFDALRREANAHADDFLPVHKGEMNFCLRGCYASVARFKYAFRKAEADLVRAETTHTAIAAATRTAHAELHDAWDSVIFNAFHDILPGSSIERAYEQQSAELGHVRHVAARAETDALNALASRVDTTVRPVTGDAPTAVPLLVWNPHPYEYRGHVELEESLDSRPIWSYRGRENELPVEVRGPNGRSVTYQGIPTEHTAMVGLPWRKRVAIPVTLPPLGWAVYTLGYVEGARPPADSPRLPPRTIRNARLDVSARPGAKAIVVRHATDAREVLSRIEAVTVDDPWGSWGGMDEDPKACSPSVVRHAWKISAVETLEAGAERCVLGVKMVGGASELELRLTLWRDRAALDVAVRVLWNERSARLQLVLRGAGSEAEYEVPGGTAVRGACGDVPGGRWVRSGALGFASDALYSFNLRRGALYATVCRASRYANDQRTAADEAPWLPAVDRGELTFRCLLTPALAELPRLADELERPPVVLPVPASSGTLPRRGSFMRLTPGSLRLLALKPAETGKGIVLRAQARTKCRAMLRWLGRGIDLGTVRAGEIATWKLPPTGKATRVDAADEKVLNGVGIQQSQELF